MRKVLGLILELNPFHNGHAYFIEKAKEELSPDVTVAIVSTNFSMRGDIHVIDKFTKTKMLLDYGIDVILELPFLSGVASADYFSFNCVKTLVDFGITDLAFGAECENLDELLFFKNISNSDEFNLQIKEYMNKGYSYSTSSVKAIQSITNDLDKAKNFSLPNNTLAIQYLNATSKLNKDIKITVIKRENNNYYDFNTSGELSSATSLRELLIKNEAIDNYIPKIFHDTKYIDITKANNNLYNLFVYKMSSSSKDELTNIINMNEGIENRLLNFIDESDYLKFLKSAETKRYTKSYLKRLILQTILNVPKSLSPQYYNYLRVLGMNENGKKYISKLNKEIKKSIITTFKNKEDNICVQFELLATKIYGIITNNYKLYLNEYKIPILGEKYDNTRN